MPQLRPMQEPYPRLACSSHPKLPLNQPVLPACILRTRQSSLSEMPHCP